jgi:hypothetical protein
MDDICILTQKINKLEADHKAYVEFGAGCFIGLIATGIMINYHYDPLLWLVLLALTGSLIAAIVITVKKDLLKDRYMKELEQFQVDRSLVQAG